MSEITKEQLAVISNVVLWVNAYRGNTSMLSVMDATLIDLVDVMIEAEKPKTCAPPNSTGAPEYTFHVLKQGTKSEVFLWNGSYYFKTATKGPNCPRNLYKFGYRYHKPVDLT